MSPSSVCNTKVGNCIGSKHIKNDGNTPLQQATEEALLELSRTIVRFNPDKYVTPWVLFCRAVALGLRSSTGQPGPTRVSSPGVVGGEDDGGDDQGDTEDGFVMISESKIPPNKPPTQSPVQKIGDKTGAVVGGTGIGATSMSYQQYAGWCRDQAVSKVQGLPVIVRIRVKCVAVKCASESLCEFLSLTQKESLRGGEGEEEVYKKEDGEEEKDRSRNKCDNNNSNIAEKNKGNKGMQEDKIVDSGGTSGIRNPLRVGTVPISSCHIDLGQARISTQLALHSNACVGDLGSNLSEIPCYLSLFMSDLVNVACACATFTVEDCSVLGLQRVSLLLLKGILNLFKRTLDPDSDQTITFNNNQNHRHNNGNSHKMNKNDTVKVKLLSLFITQFISAIRPCLSVLGAPDLLGLSGELIVTLIREGLLLDKVVLKRLLKALSLVPHRGNNTQADKDYNNSDSNSNISSANEKIDNTNPDGNANSVRASLSSDVGEDICVLDHLTRAHTAAQLYLLTNTEITNNSSTKASHTLLDVSLKNSMKRMSDEDETRDGETELNWDIKDCLTNEMNAQIPYLQGVWMALSVDTARVLQVRGSGGEFEGGGVGMASALLGSEREKGVTAGSEIGMGLGSSSVTKSGDTYDRYAPPDATEGREPPAPVTRKGTGTGMGGDTDTSSGFSLSGHSQERGGVEEDGVPVVRVVSKERNKEYVVYTRHDESDLDTKNNTNSSSNSGNGSGSRGNIWTTCSVETDPRRGGLTYPASVSPVILVQTLDRFLPEILSASALALFESKRHKYDDKNNSGKSNGSKINNENTKKISDESISPRNSNSNSNSNADGADVNNDDDNNGYNNKNIYVDIASKKANNGSIDVLFAIFMTALAHYHRKIKYMKSMRAIDGNNDLNSSYSHYSAVSQLYRGLTLLSKLPFLPFITEHNSFENWNAKVKTTNNNDKKITKDGIDENENKIDSENTKNVPSTIPLSQWHRLISFTIKSVLLADNKLFFLPKYCSISKKKLSQGNNLFFTEKFSENVFVKIVNLIFNLMKNLKMKSKEEMTRKKNGESNGNRNIESDSERGGAEAHERSTDIEKLKILIFSFAIFSICSIFSLLDDSSSRSEFQDLLRGHLPQIKCPSFPLQSGRDHLTQIVARLEGETEDTQGHLGVISILLSILSDLAIETRKSIEMKCPRSSSFSSSELPPTTSILESPLPLTSVKEETFFSSFFSSSQYCNILQFSRKILLSVHMQAAIIQNRNLEIHSMKCLMSLCRPAVVHIHDSEVIDENGKSNGGNDGNRNGNSNDEERAVEIDFTNNSFGISIYQLQKSFFNSRALFLSLKKKEGTGTGTGLDRGWDADCQQSVSNAALSAISAILRAWFNWSYSLSYSYSYSTRNAKVVLSIVGILPMCTVSRLSLCFASLSLCYTSLSLSLSFSLSLFHVSLSLSLSFSFSLSLSLCFTSVSLSLILSLSLSLSLSLFHVSLSLSLSIYLSLFHVSLSVSDRKSVV